MTPNAVSPGLHLLYLLLPHLSSTGDVTELPSGTFACAFGPGDPHPEGAGAQQRRAGYLRPHRIAAVLESIRA